MYIMEEGGEKWSCFFTECNKDRLATVGGSSKTREESKTQWLACGFNGFGQLKFENKRRLLEFQEIQIPAYFKNDDVLLACSWQCLVVASRCFLHLQGFISNSTKNFKTIHTAVPIKFLEICDKFCLLLTEDGKVYKLMLGTEENALQEVKFQTGLIHTITENRNIFGGKKDTSVRIAHIACGNNMTIAVSTANSVFCGTVEIYQFAKHQRVKQIKCGFEHALLLTSNGDIYAWGNGLRGQLGSDVLRVVETPTLIECLSGIKITYIAAGGWHSAAISSFGDVYTWGFNSDGQLSLRVYKTAAKILKEPSVYPLPQAIDLSCQCDNNSCYPINVFAGARHTILQMKCGSVIACGWNEYGQLGLPKYQQYCDNFEFVLKLNNKKIVCGNWCTLIQK